jgi:hypothetical protein
MTTPQRRRPPAARPGGTAPRRGKPLGGRYPTGAGGTAPRGGKAPGGRYPTGVGGTRSSVERSSARPLLFLRQLPAWLPPLATLALLITGFALPGWIGGTALALVAVFLGWLGYLSWPALAARGRLLRVAAVACVLVLAVIQAGR